MIEGRQVINTNTAAKEEGMRLLQAGAEMTIFNYTIWCYPQFTAVARNFAPGPYLLFSNQHPSECGMVGMLAAAGHAGSAGVEIQAVMGFCSIRRYTEAF